MHEPIVNEHGIVLNPIEEVLYNTKLAKISITYSHVPGDDKVWSFGYSIQTNFGSYWGCSSGVSTSQSFQDARPELIHPNQFSVRQAALDWCIQRVRENSVYEKHKKDKINILNGLLENNQQSLF